MQINDILQVLPLFLNHSNAAIAIEDASIFSQSTSVKGASRPNLRGMSEPVKCIVVSSMAYNIVLQIAYRPKNKKLN